MNRDIQQLLKKAKRAGCRVEQTRSNHYRIIGPTGESISAPGTPSDFRSIRDVRSKLRRIGVSI